MTSRKRFTFSVPAGLMRNMTHSQKLLGQIIVKIQKINALGQRALVVFDLDSTLFDVNPRLDQILLDFAADSEFKKRFPTQVDMLNNIKTLRGDWGIKMLSNVLVLMENILSSKKRSTSSGKILFFQMII